MLSFVIRLVINAAALFFISGASGGTILVKDPTSAIIAALLLGLANAFVKPVLGFFAKILTLPLSCITLGLWSLLLSWLLNAAMFYLVGQVLTGFQVKGFWPAMWGSLALSVVNAIATGLFSDKDDSKR